MLQMVSIHPYCTDYGLLPAVKLSALSPELIPELGCGNTDERFASLFHRAPFELHVTVLGYDVVHIMPVRGDGLTLFKAAHNA